MLTFNPIDPDAKRVLTFNFQGQLTPTEVLMGGPQVSVVCCAGEDNNAENIFGGLPPAYDSTGTQILQPVENLTNLVGNDYLFEAISATTNPNKTVVSRAILPVRIT